MVLSVPPSLQVPPPVLITFTMKLVASLGTIKVLPLHSFCMGVAAIAVVSVVYSSPCWKFVCIEPALWHMPVPQLALKMVFTAA